MTYDFSPKDLALLESSTCTAHSKSTGELCRQPAIPGGSVCRFHGGGAPQVRAKAAERLQIVIDLALDKLIERLAPPVLGTDPDDLPPPVETKDLVSIVDKFIGRHQLLTGQATSRDESSRVEVVRQQLELRLDSQATRVASLVEGANQIIDVKEVDDAPDAAIPPTP